MKNVFLDRFWQVIFNPVDELNCLLPGFGSREGKLNHVTLPNVAREEEGRQDGEVCSSVWKVYKRRVLGNE
jgi:hypothetical protein